MERVTDVAGEAITAIGTHDGRAAFSIVSI